MNLAPCIVEILTVALLVSTKTTKAATPTTTRQACANGQFTLHCEAIKDVNAVRDVQWKIKFPGTTWIEFSQCNYKSGWRCKTERSMLAEGINLVNNSNGAVTIERSAGKNTYDHARILCLVHILDYSLSSHVYEINFTANCLASASTPIVKAPPTADKTAPPTADKTAKAPPSTDKTVYVIIAIGTLISIVMIAGGIIYLRYKCSRFLKKDKLHHAAEFRYDAFIIFNNKDQKWVDETLLPILEVENGLKCCVHYRDFVPGIAFVQNMTDSVQNSKNTIAVVSENFFTSSFCKYELDQAIYKHIKQGYNTTIVIRIDNVSKEKLPDALKNKSFIDYSNLIERKTWHLKLIKVLKSNSNDIHR